MMVIKSNHYTYASKNKCLCKKLWKRNQMNVFFIEDDQLLKICNSIWNRVSSSIKKELDCEPIYNKNF